MSDWGNSNLLIGNRLDRPASTQTAIKQKEGERQELLTAVELFKAQGGVIQQIPASISKEAQLSKMRAGEMELIDMVEIARRWKINVRTVPAVLAKWPTLMYIMQGTQRVYSLDDIKRCEMQTDYKLHSSVI